MEDKLCPLRMLGKNNNSVLWDDKERSVISDYKCFGERCAWFIKNKSKDYDLAECAVMSLVSIQYLVR